MLCTSKLELFYYMDAVFFLHVEARGLFLRTIAQTTGCIYICLWSYVPLISNCFFCIDGWYNDESNQPSSSSGSLGQRLFNAYRETQHSLDNSCVPGLAFQQGIPYLEVKELELLQRASNDSQQRFYQEVRVKSAAFFSCGCGEIEIGMSTSIPVNMEFEILNWFQQSQFNEPILPPQDQNWPSSSSSSLKSLSVGSPENSSLLFSMPSTSYVPMEQAIRPTSTAALPHRKETIEAYNLLRIQNLNQESDHAAMTRAILAVISSPSSSSSSYNQHQQTRNYISHVSQKTGAFKEYTSAPAPNIQMKVNSGKQNMLKRSISIMRNISQSYREELIMQGIPPTSSQLHHKISERKRREKLNESFQELRSLLPAGSKKDKASVLSNTLDYLSNLKTEVEELKQKNELLEARASHVRGTSEEVLGDSSNEKTDVQITRASESTSEEQDMDLQVTVRGDCNIIDLILDILEYLKLVSEASLVSLNADTELLQTNSINRVILRFKIKGSEWDEPAFLEDMRKIVADTWQTNKMAT